MDQCITSYISVYNDGSLDADGGGGSPYNPPFPEGGGVGGGEHSGTVSTIPQQCNPTPLIVNGLPPCTKGNGLGWEVVELDIKTSLDFLINNYDEYYFDNTINSDLYFSNCEEFKDFINAAPQIEFNNEQLITQLGEVVQIATVNRSLIGGYKFFIKTKKELNSGIFSIVAISSDMWGFTLAWSFNQTPIQQIKLKMK